MWEQEASSFKESSKNRDIFRDMESTTRGHCIKIDFSWKKYHEKTFSEKKFPEHFFRETFSEIFFRDEERYLLEWCEQSSAKTKNNSLFFFILVGGDMLWFLLHS